MTRRRSTPAPARVPIQDQVPVERREAYVHPGDVVVSARPHALTTILGPCVAVCVWDVRTRAGGMNHFVLPGNAAGEAGSARFGSEALRMLLAKMRSLGSAAGDMRARAFGGACMLPTLASRGGTLGDRNADLALRFLSDHAVRLVETDLGGRQSRRVVFHTDTGQAWLRLLTPAGGSADGAGAGAGTRR